MTLHVELIRVFTVMSNISLRHEVTLGLFFPHIPKDTNKLVLEVAPLLNVFIC